MTRGTPFEKLLKLSTRVKYSPNCNPEVLWLDTYLREIKYMQSHVQNIHNNQKLGKIQISINLKMDKLWSNHTMKHNSVIKAKCWYMQQHGLNSHLVCWVREIRHERVPPYDLYKVQGQVKWTYSDNGCIHRCKWKGTQCFFFF